MPTIKELPAGIISAENFAANTTYIANAAGTTIRGNGPANPSKILGSNVTLRGIKFTNGGVKRDAVGNNTLIDGCDFTVCRNAIELYGASATIQFCLFQNVDFPTWIGDSSDLLITLNEAIGVGYGFKVFGDSTTNKNRKLIRNYVHDCKTDFMCIEFQGATDGWEVRENLAERFAYGGAMVDNDHSMVYSLPNAKSKNGLVIGNILHAKKPRGPGYPDAWIDGAPAALEMGGNNTRVEGNWWDGAGVAMTCTDKDVIAGFPELASILLRNNYVTNCWSVWNKNHDKQIVTLEGVNGPTAPPPSGHASWAAYEQWLRSVVGRQPAPTPPDPIDDCAAIAAENEELRKQLAAKDAQLAEWKTWHAEAPK